ncbi:c-type cytochrome biogenesis protein CcmI [Sediminicoccus sp. KRV36]|uniref:c-type cytochrome biogenesis protein CcmI n=1 Tax=Sediminicoccus sp. KRV36 TaxID=3133721 RepID=UPI00200CFCF5|nr:c-type cytochrome biogenesis protein CcmI [Sediminicoccus rosea]
MAALILSPLAYTLLRPPAARGRGEADVALFHAQLAELETQRAEGRLDEAAFNAATVEVQRRLLAAPAPQQLTAPARPSLLLLAALVLVPAAGVLLYVERGFPDMPSATLAVRQEADAQDEAMLVQLRARLATADPNTQLGRQGFILLGNAERNRGRLAEAVAAWERALAGGFDVGLAGDVAEIEIERNEPANALRWISRGLAMQPQDARLRFLAGLAEARAGRNEVARAIWTQLLAEAPADAPWRNIVQERLGGLN